MGNQFKIIIFLLLVGTLFTSCNGVNSEMSDVEFSQFSDTNSNSEARKKQAFENTVYQITRKHCASCHAAQTPVHAHADSAKAMNSLFDNAKVDFSNFHKSRIVAKIRDENHGCWSDCETNAAEMESMVSKWYELIQKDIKDGGHTNTTEECYTEIITTPGADPVVAYADVGLHQIFINQCSSCHNSNTDRSPFGDANPQVAFDAAYGDGSGTYLDFANAGQGRMVTQVKTGHNGNCNVGSGECAAIAEQITSAVTQWALAAQATTREVEKCTNIEEGVINSSTPIMEAGQSSGNQNGGELLATQATLAGDFVLIGDYIEVPNNGVGPLTGDSGNSASFNFNIQDAGNYEIIAEVNGPSDSDNSFQVQMDGGTINPFRFAPTSGFEMIKVSEGNNDNNDVFSQFNLAAGAHTVVFHLREDGTQLKKIKIQPVGSSSQNPSIVLSFDLSGVTGIANNRLEMDFKILDSYSYEASNVRMINGAGLFIKNLKVFVNGSFNTQHSTYTLIEKTIATNDEQISPYNMIILKDQGEYKDVIGIKFEVIEK